VPITLPFAEGAPPVDARHTVDNLPRLERIRSQMQVRRPSDWVLHANLGILSASADHHVVTLKRP
jgi:hypothetical protein